MGVNPASPCISHLTLTYFSENTVLTVHLEDQMIIQTRASIVIGAHPRVGKPILPYHSHEAVLVCAFCPLLTIDSLHCSSCPLRRCHPQPHLLPTLYFKRSSKLRSNHTKSRQRKTFSHIRSPPKYNHATPLPPYSLSCKIGFENSIRTVRAMSD